jgi:hypothetical protein
VPLEQDPEHLGLVPRADDQLDVVEVLGHRTPAGSYVSMPLGRRVVTGGRRETRW